MNPQAASTATKSLPWMTIISLVSALVYGASPIDVIPDLIPLLGLVDDAIAIPLLIVLAIFGWRRFKKGQLKPANATVTVPSESVVVSSPPQIPQRRPDQS